LVIERLKGVKNKKLKKQKLEKYIGSDKHRNYYQENKEIKKDTIAKKTNYTI